MVTDKIKELETARTKLVELENTVAAALKQELASLPTRYGFENVEAFIAALRSAGTKRRGRKPGSSSSAPAKPSAVKRRKRARITDETRANVKKLLEGGKTGGEIAATLGISLPSVHNIKKALGLVGKSKTGRKAKAEKK